MPPRTQPVRVKILFDAADYRIFVSATRQLRRIMGRSAPDVAALIVFNLQGRDATGIADDYLDAIRWPSSAGRIVVLKSSRPTPIRPNRSGPQVTRVSSLRSRGSVDPSRN